MDNEQEQPLTAADDALDSIELDAVIDEAKGIEPEPEPEPEKSEGQPEEQPEGQEQPKEKSEPEKPARTLEDIEKEADSIEVPKNAHANVKKAIPAMREHLKEVATMVREAQARAEEAERKLQEAQTKLPEDVAKQLEELRAFKRAKDIENDPEIVSKYDSVLTKLGEESASILEQAGFSEKVRNYIAENGGVVAVRYSNKMMPNGEDTQAEWFEKQILGSMDSLQHKADMEDSINESRRLLRERGRALEALKADAAAYEKAQQELAEKQQSEMKARAEATFKNVIEKLGVSARKWEVTEKSSPEEKEWAEWHNKNLDLAAKTYESIVGKNDPEIEIQKSIAASQYVYVTALNQRLSEKNTQLEAKLKEMEGKLGKINKAGRTASQSNAPIRDANKKPVETDKLLHMSDSRAFDEVVASLGN